MKWVHDMTINFNNYARKIGKRGNYDWYQWKVFVDENEDVLNQINNVQYLLHQTFPNPLRLSDNEASKFALESSGWGSFTIYITVKFKNKHEEEVQYYLDLDKKWPI